MMTQAFAREPTVFAQGPRRALAISATLALVTTTSLAGPLFKVKLEGIDPQDVDLLIAHTGKLVNVLDAFLKKDGGLEDAIKQAKRDFTTSLKCAADYGSNTFLNRVEAKLPNFSALRDPHTKACAKATLLESGRSMLEQFTFEHCVVRELIVSKPVSFIQISHAYDGLKDLANAALCHRIDDKSQVAKSAKDNFSIAGILSAAYADIDKVSGCSLSTPKDLYSCTLAYAQDTLSYARKSHPNDSAEIDLQTIDNEAQQLKPPELDTSFWRETREVLTVDKLVEYQRLTANAKRARDWIEARRASRSADYDRMASALAKHAQFVTAGIAGTDQELERRYLECSYSGPYCYSLEWTRFQSVQSSNASAQELCRSLREAIYSDLISVPVSKTCEQQRNFAIRIRDLMAHFSDLDKRQRKASREQERMDKAPK